MQTKEEKNNFFLKEPTRLIKLFSYSSKLEKLNECEMHEPKEMTEPPKLHLAVTVFLHLLEKIPSTCAHQLPPLYLACSVIFSQVFQVFALTAGKNKAKHQKVFF